MRGKDDFEFCEDMKCLNIFKEGDCVPTQCPKFHERMKMVGSIYGIGGDHQAHFLGKLPRVTRKAGR